MQTDENDYDKIYKYLSDKEWRLNNLYYIKDKDGKKIKFKFNWAQELYHRTKHNRNIILKARQLGITTYKCIDKLDNALFNSFVDAGIICHNLEDAEKIFTHKVKFAYNNLPQWLKDRRVPNNDRAGELRFSNDSSISVSAGFRGGTLAGGLHVSEYGKMCAKYPLKAKEVKSGALNAVPLNSDADFESTAEGMTGDFYDMCEKAQALDPDNLTPLDFKFHFFPWYKAKEYRLDPEWVEIPDEYKNYFKSLKEDQGIELDDSQKAWYYKKSQEQTEDMKQEYPSYPEEAFRASGRPVFNLEKLARDIKRAKDNKPFKGTVDAKGFTELTNGPIHIYKKPVTGEAYAIGADVAEGLVDGDFSTASIINKNFEQVATYCGHIAPDKFGSMLVSLAKYYNGAILAPEINSIGISVIESIKREKYYKVYKREVREELGKEIQEKIGWHTNIKTKMLMIDDLRAAFRDDVIIINDVDTLREMMTLTIEDDGNIEMNSKDRSVALAISIQALKQASLSNEHKAFTPGKSDHKDPIKMSVEDRLKYYKRKNRHG
jgi:hypothetical protein